MSYSILGAGAVGKALAKAFARKGLEVSIASRKSVEALAPIANAIGPTVIPKSLNDALEAEVILLAIPFATYPEIAKSIPTWEGKLVIDATNAYGVPPEKLGNRASSTAIAEALAGADLVKAFNHLPAATLAQDPEIDGDRRVLFLSSNSEGAARKVASIVEQLGYAGVFLGKLEEGGRLVQAHGNSWAPLIFQDLFRKGE
ncbi:MAG: NAD(P)-binding domain-containing protein [Edaphobacter sp.]|uniref:NADPH-dependent F420 reductase n=1 Tax=Edaphobacter sp. TaxID=1934404 RepID=UPI00238C585F|nr:NAD(P)-binding domain-containing protein [Edaphobacter sp.]MDE1177533.1 NAD(P)-binding domain-containing protein [Edaphobacter sp.]